MMMIAIPFSLRVQIENKIYSFQLFPDNRLLSL